MKRPKQMPNWPEEEFISDAQREKHEREVDEWAHEKSSALMKILEPHRYEIRKSIFGANDIACLLNDPAYNTDIWPQYMPTALIAGKINIVDEFYGPMFDRMREQYFAYAYKKHGYKTYDQLKQLPIFDISCACKNSTSNMNISISLPESTLSLIKNKGSKIFTPSVPEFVVKTDKHHMIYFKLLEKDADSDIYTLRIEDYLVNKRDNCCVAAITISYQLEENGNGIEWDASEYIPYESFLTEDISDMKWSLAEESFWYDVLGVDKLENMVMIKAPICFDESHRLCVDVSNQCMDIFYVYTELNAQYVRREIQRIYKSAKIDIICKGREANDICHQTRLESLFPRYLSMIAAINGYLLENKTRLIAPEDKKSVSVGEMIVKTVSPVRINVR